MDKKITSYAFIDANNLILGLKKANIKLDYQRFILVSGDGDFADLLYSFQENQKKIKIIVPYSKYFSKLFSPFEKKCLCLDFIKNRI